MKIIITNCPFNHYPLYHHPGDFAVGKTALMHRFADDCFVDSSTASTAQDFKVKLFHLKNKVVRLNVWDTTDKERVAKSLNYTFFRCANGIVLVST